MRCLYVLYDARCGLCSWSHRWLRRQPAFLELIFIPAGSERAARMFPGVERPGMPEELIVIADDGAVYREGRAWIMCLYALQEYREWSIRLARPMLLPLARQAFALLSKNRSRISRWLNLASEAEIAETLRQVHEPACDLPRPETLADRLAQIRRVSDGLRCGCTPIRDRVHQVDQGDDVVHRGLGEDAVPEVEDVAGSAPGLVEDPTGPALDLGPRREQGDRVEVALDADSRPET
jgi:predicted DCC family thiol-disulfide oxidoreductase YuxK